MCLCSALMCIYAPWTSYTCTGLEKALNPLELELQTVVRHHVGIRNWMPGLLEEQPVLLSSKPSLHLQNTGFESIRCNILNFWLSVKMFLYSFLIPGHFFPLLVSWANVCWPLSKIKLDSMILSIILFVSILLISGHVDFLLWLCV